MLHVKCHHIFLTVTMWCYTCHYITNIWHNHKSSPTNPLSLNYKPLSSKGLSSTLLVPNYPSLKKLVQNVSRYISLTFLVIPNCADLRLRGLRVLLELSEIWSKLGCPRILNISISPQMKIKTFMINHRNN